MDLCEGGELFDHIQDKGGFSEDDARVVMNKAFFLASEVPEFCSLSFVLSALQPQPDPVARLWLA